MACRLFGLNETNEPLRLLETVNHLAGLPKRERRRSQGLFTWDYLEAGQNHREIDIEVSQWGDPASKEYAVCYSAYYVPANVFRFISPSMRLSIRSAGTLVRYYLGPLGRCVLWDPMS